MALSLLGILGCMSAEGPDVSPEGRGAVLPALPPGPKALVLGAPPMVQRAPGLVINEVISANESQWQDPTNLDTPDWLELFNNSDTSIALKDVEVKFGGNKWKGDDGEIAAGGYFFLIADGLTDDSSHAPFGISSLGEEIELQVNNETVDRISTGPMYDDVVWARFPDGGAWLPSIRSTPGWTNGSSPPESLDPRDTVFQLERVLRVDLGLTAGAISGLNSGGLFSETWVTGDIVIDGLQYPGSGVRLKGSGSYEDMNGKPNFKLDVNTADTGLRFRGLRAITLNSGNIYDPSRTHEYLAYALAREVGLAAPRVGWAHVYVNGEDYGIYQNVETWDEEFYSYWWPTQDTGQLFEGSGCDFGDSYDPTACKYDEGPEVPDLSGVIALDEMVEAGANGPAKSDLWTMLNHDKFLTYLAWEAVTDHWDGYRSPNNWRFFEDGQTGLFEWLPSGTDWTWDGSPDVFGGNGAVSNLCLDIPDCKREFEDYVVVVADATDALQLDDTLYDLRGWLHDEIVADPRSDHSESDVNSTFDSTMQYIQNNPDDARAAVN